MKAFKIIVIALVILVLGLGIISIFDKPAASLGAGGIGFNTTPSFVFASSTTYSVSTASIQILATTTATKRIATAIQNINCARTVFLNANRDVAATVGNGLALQASTTLSLGDYYAGTVPVIQGAVRAITDTGTCTVLVTEYKSQY